ncbi:type II toxin-antitoxin system RelE/ParE family toxin [Bradyrhizobium stylosanthis]|uniref:type II toxin-antitoxin system RelE/ParE family toxin n=1 Tax=Bradyrhizobium stylosanthis TaxID=1803665 RepID=UPI003D32046C
MRVRWSESALSDIDSIFSYIHERNRTAAVAVVERIHRPSAPGLSQGRSSYRRTRRAHVPNRSLSVSCVLHGQSR